ncbi:hypothetical protein SS50377_20062 [Spironucleus salmonicida]|uniref:DUF1764 family protein n=1 Tax=Spironucleus salmonicida TaxID=348837 RepID=V6M7F2_9EUKA|nr:hypothetical protein SS50377_20062 [Spironucleus salmonicida]|eukprot:EST49369.1 hypothetical protein SS50377_10294 [Spironucleus salmonicida]
MKDKKLIISKPLKREDIIKSQVQEENKLNISVCTDFDDVDQDIINGVIEQLKKKKKSIQPKAELKRKKDHKRKYTDDGFPIYTSSELKIGLPGSGNTHECPFDCDCCF